MRVTSSSCDVINVTMFTLTAGRPAAVINRQQLQQACKMVYIVIRDSDGPSLTVCSGVTRRTVYESRSHSVEIRVVGSKTALNSAGMLLRFDGKILNACRKAQSYDYRIVNGDFRCGVISVF